MTMATASTFSHISPKQAKAGLAEISVVIRAIEDAKARARLLARLAEVLEFIETEGRAVEFAHTAYTSYRDGYHKLSGEPVNFRPSTGYWYECVQSELRALEDISKKD